MKKGILRIFSLCLSISVILSTILLPEIFAFAESANSYNVQVIKFPVSEKLNGSGYEYTYENESTALTPEISGDKLTISGWSAASTTNNTQNYIYAATENESANATTKTYSFAEGNGIMFYVKTAIGTPANELFFQMVTSTKGEPDKYGATQWIMLSKATNVYYLQKGDTEWTTLSTVQSTVASTSGNIIIPSGFEGWIRLPYDAFNIKEGFSTELKRFNFYLKALGSKYTASEISIGSFMILDNGSENFTAAFYDGAQKSLLVELPCHNAHLLTPTDVSGASVADNETAIADGYTYSVSDKTAEFTVSDQTPVGEAILSYLRLPLDGDSKVMLKINGKTLKENIKLYALDRGDFTFKKVTVDADGNVTLPDGFEGYLLVPSTAYDGLVGQTVSKVSFETENAGFAFGSVMLSDNAAPELIIRMDYDKAPVHLLKDAYYKGTMLETENTVTSSMTDNTYYNVSEKVTDNEFSIGIDESYYYEMSVGNAENGIYKIDSSVQPSYTGTAANGITAAKRPISNSPFTVAADKEDNSITVSVDTAVKTDGIYEISKYGDLTTNYAIAKYAAATAPTLSTTGSLMFYVKHNDASKAVRIVVGHGWYFASKSSKYYLLSSGSATWQSYTAEAITTENPRVYQGYIEIPASFEGWVRIPASTLIMGNNTKYTTASVIKEIYVGPEKLGGDYGTLTVGKFITVAESEKDYTSIKLGAEELSLVPSTKPYSAIAANGITAAKRPISNSPFTVAADKEDNSITVSVDTAVKTDGIYEISKYGDLTTNYAIAKYDAATAPTLSTTGSLMFYVKHNDASKAVRIVVGHGWYFASKNSKYYLLSNGSDTWQSHTAEAITTENSRVYQGYIEIPASFEGWVRIPASTLIMGNNKAYTAATVIKEIYVAPEKLGGDYGTLTVGDFITVAESDERFCFDYGDGVKMPINSSIEIVDTGNYFTITMGIALNQKVFTADASAGEYNSAIALKNEATLNTDNAFMFYIRQTGNATSQLSVELADAGMKMLAGAKYQIYDAQKQNWTEKTALDSGKIEIAGGYSGWIKIPYGSLTDIVNAVDPDGFTFSKILVTPYQLGSAYGNIKIGSFMIVNHGDEALATMRVNKAAEASLTIREAYTAKTMLPSDVLGMGINARSIVAENINTTILEGGYLYSVESTHETVSMDESSALEVTVSGGLIENEDGLIMYVKIPEGNDNAVVLGGAFKTAANGEYYILNFGNESVWENKTANADGTMPIPTGFDGYIRIPFSSMENTPTGEITKFIFGLSKIGGDYGEVLFGTFMLSENTGYEFYDIYVDVIDYSQSLLQPEYYEGYVLQGTATVEGTADMIAVTKAQNDTLTTNIPEGYSYAVSAVNDAVQLTEKEKTPRVSFAIDKLYQSKLSPSGAVMFYVDISNSTENTMYLEVVGDITVNTAAGSRFSTLQSGNAYWEEHVTDGNGYLPFVEGFSGWVRVPFTSLKDSKGVSLKDSVKQINFTFKNVGGNYGAPQVASIIMLTNNGEFGKIKFSGYTDKITLYGANQKTEYTRDDIAIWDSVIDPFVTYQSGNAITVKPTVDKTVEDEVNNVFSGKVISGITPFDAKGIEYTSEKALDSHDSHYPRVSVATPFSVKDTAGIVMYLKLPDNGAEENSAFIQMQTTGNKWVSIKKEFMIPVLQKGATDWEYVFVRGERIKFPAGFEGYVYISLEAMVTTSASGSIALNKNDVVSNVIIGVDRYGGSAGTVILGGMFLSRNGVLSHNGAYVDGDTICRDVFIGTAVSEDAVRYSVYDTPGKVGAYLKDVPTPTEPDYIVDLDNITGHSVDVFFEAYPNANRYRIDVYKINALADAFSGTYYEYLGSKWTNTTTATIDGLETGTSYTLVVLAFKNDKGLAIYSLCPATPEGKIVGDMYIANTDPYKYEWLVDSESEEYEWVYEYIYDEVEEEEDSNSETDSESDSDMDSNSEKDESIKTERVKKVLRRRKAGGIETWVIVVIIVAIVVVLVTVALVTIILIKKKRRNSK